MQEAAATRRQAEREAELREMNRDRELDNAYESSFGYRNSFYDYYASNLNRPQPDDE